MGMESVELGAQALLDDGAQTLLDGGTQGLLDGGAQGACREQRCCAGKHYFCSVELALQVIGGKWKPIILWHLRTGEKQRFGELRRHMPNVTQKMLTQQLRELESDGMILRKVHPQVPPKVEYSLTSLGQSVMPVLDQLSRWGTLFEAEHPARGEG